MGSPTPPGTGRTAPAPTGHALSSSATPSPVSLRSSPDPHVHRVFSQSSRPASLHPISVGSAPGGASGQMSEGFPLHPRQSPPHILLSCVQVTGPIGCAGSQNHSQRNLALLRVCRSETSRRRTAVLWGPSFAFSVSAGNCETWSDHGKPAP